MSAGKFICDCTVVHKEIVDDVKKAMIDMGEYKKLALFFKVFADETRIKILWALDLSEMCVCDICSVLDMTKSAVSHQLALLRREHLVKCRREGKSVYYSLDDEHVKQVFETGLEHIRHF